MRKYFFNHFYIQHNDNINYKKLIFLIIFITIIIVFSEKYINTIQKKVNS